MNGRKTKGVYMKRYLLPTLVALVPVVILGGLLAGPGAIVAIFRIRSSRKAKPLQL